MQHFSYCNICAFTEIHFILLMEQFSEITLWYSRYFMLLCSSKVNFWTVFTGYMLFILEDSLSLDLFGNSWLRTVRIPFYSLAGSCFLSPVFVTMNTEHFFTISNIPRFEPCVNTAHLFYIFPNFLCSDNSYYFSSKLSSAISSLKTFFFLSTHIHTQSMCKTLNIQS